MEYPRPSEKLTRVMVGAQLHHTKLRKDLQDMIELCEAKIQAHMMEDRPNVEEIAKTKKIKRTCQLELDKRRFSGLEDK